MVDVRPDKNLIILTRGDTLILDINIKDENGNDYTPDESDTLRFALKKKYSDDEALILKDIPINTCQLRLESEDTKSLEQPGEYVFDIQLTYGDGIVSTIIPNKNAKTAKLKLIEEVE